MAGGHMKYRTLGRDSAHRKALLRNLVTSLVKQESIQTTYAKAKEAQTVADKLITLAKRNNETARRAAQGILFTPDQLLPKLFGELRERYADRPGGYTRVLRIEPLNRHNKLDQAESAILEFVDGNVDTRFAMTAAAVARSEALGRKLHPNTVLNVKKVTAFRKDGPAEFRAMVRAIKQGGHVNKFPSSETENAGWHLDRYAQNQAAYETQLEEWNDLRKQKYQTDVPAQAEDKREGRGARQRRLRREKKAAYGPDAAEGEAQHGTAVSEWEDLEDATEADGKDRRVHREKPAVRGSGGRSPVKRLRKPVKPTLGVKIRAPKKARASF